VHFHRVLKGACARFDPDFHRRFKSWCDDYFFIAHRQEPRGVGGIFFDYLGAGAERADKRAPSGHSPVEEDPERVFAFVQAVGDALIEAYLPLVERRRDEPWTEAQRHWQLVRRGRYVEFNLVYDRGTAFGLKTGGRTESILMSLPPEARWESSSPPPTGSPEAKTLEAIKARRDWAGES
jgi:coproporphyrinogen III oxidase